MRSFFFFLLIILLTIILSTEEEKGNSTKTSKKKENKEENNNLNNPDDNTKKQEDKKKSKKKKKKSKKDEKKEKEKEENKLVPPPPLSFISDIPKDTYNLPNDGVYLLNDKTIDKVLQNGNNYRWLVILFSETCGHCYFARTEIRRILPEFKYSSYLRFAELEININPMSNMRFNIEGVPYIFILQNNTMYLMDSYASRKNLLKFLETDLSYFLPEEKRPFPPSVQFKQYWLDNLKNSFRELTNSANELLIEHGIKYEFTPFVFFIATVVVLILSCVLEYLCCLKFCPDEEEAKEEEKNNNEEKEKKEKYNEDIKENKENKEISEEEKIKKEKEKENEEKKKEDKKGEKKKDGNEDKIKTNKKMKKE